MIKRILLIIVSICTVLSTSQISFMTVQAADDQYGEFINGWYHITRQSQLESISAKIADGDEAYGSARYVLDNDIILSPNTNTAINIGTSSNPFRGVFDGNGYTVSNFTYTGEAERCTSFFGFTEDAVIKNINFNNASISAVNGGGIVAGKATDTDFLNIGIKDSTITLYSGGSVIELITADGITAGAIVAWAYDNTRLYNCETDNVVLDTGSFEFLSALSGDGYYIGGLVGTLEDSMIEYSRTKGTGKKDGGRISFDITDGISAFGGKCSHIGGIAGEMKGNSTLLDCYSSLYLYNRFALAVGVAAGINVKTGGLVGTVWAGSNGESSIERCHYSGMAESYLSNPIVFFPITEKNKNIGGIVSNVELGATLNIINSHYNSTRILEEDQVDSLVTKKVNDVDATASSSTVNKSFSGDLRAAFTHDQYQFQTDWSNEGYDFDGAEYRSTACDELVGGEHINRWKMQDDNDNKDGMPIHNTASNIRIWSNYYNAFTDENALSTEISYISEADSSLSVPQLSELNELNENKEHSEYIGIALVSKRNDASGKTFYTCDKLLEPGSEAPISILNAYSNDNSKRIYAVWLQGRTIAGEFGINTQSDTTKSGIRVLTAINTKLLENIGLTDTDSDYFRGAIFKLNGSENYIQADSMQWIGEDDYHSNLYNISDSGVENPRVFSIFAELDDMTGSFTLSGKGTLAITDITGGIITSICSDLKEFKDNTVITIE